MSDFHFESELAQRPTGESSWSYPLICLFQVLTGASLFFACLRISPVLAICLTLIVTPAIVRTTIVSDLMRRRQQDFDWMLRGKVFAGSLGYVVLVSAFGFVVFALISLMFGVLGLVFSSMAHSNAVSADAIVLGTVGGMVWGVGGAVLAIVAVVLKTWMPKKLGEA